VPPLLRRVRLSVAQRRDQSPDQESRRTVNQLLTSLEAHRDERRLLVLAATNSIEHLDPAVIRPGRFDRHIRIDLPGAAARRAIFAAELDDRPAARTIDLEESCGGRCASFYPISGADVMSKWVGESEGNIRRLFQRARENRPSIVFIDEIDALAGRRGESLGVHDSHVNQLLAEIDGVSGQRGVFVIGATNRPDQLDPALLRGGPLSRTIVLGVPDAAGRLAMLRLHTARMPTVGVRLEELAGATEGFSPADLKALAQEAALAAMTRTGDDDASPAVTHEDFEEALVRPRTGARAAVV
jgi:SpoVK/Ycf46/Vps4 family AAA+-type ATPase